MNLVGGIVESIGRRGLQETAEPAGDSLGISCSLCHLLCGDYIGEYQITSIDIVTSDSDDQSVDPSYSGNDPLLTLLVYGCCIDARLGQMPRTSGHSLLPGKKGLLR